MQQPIQERHVGRKYTLKSEITSWSKTGRPFLSSDPAPAILRSFQTHPQLFRRARLTFLQLHHWDIPSHQLSMDQLKFKDCAFSVGLRNWGMSFCDFCHLPTQEPKENRQMYPRLKVAHATRSFLLFIKLHWQHLVLHWHSSPLWSPWVKCQPVRAACSTRVWGYSTCRRMGLDWEMLLFCIGMPLPENNFHLALSGHAGLSGFLPADTYTEEHLQCSLRPHWCL